MAETYTITITLTGRDQASQVMQRFNQTLRQTQTDARQVGGGLRGLVGDLGGLNNAILGAATAFAGLQLFQVVGQFADLGREINFVERRFEALTGGETALQGLREATGNVVDDLQLMKDSSSLIMTGLAADAEEAGRLIALGFQLGGEAGVEALSRALKNQSIEMLDNIGISAAAVRELRDTYIAAGMDSAQAFARATLEIGEQTRERLGDAAAAAETSWARLQTRIENATQDIGEFFARGIEAGSQLLEIVNVLFERDIAAPLAAQAAEIAAAQLSIEDTARLLAAEQALSGGAPNVGELMRLVETLTAFREQFGREPTASELTAQLSQFMPVDETVLAQAQFVLDNERRVGEIALERRQELNREYERGMALLGMQNRILEDQRAAEQAAYEASVARQEAQAAYEAHVAPLYGMGQDIFAIAAEQTGRLGETPQFMTPEQASRIEAARADFEAMYRAAKDAYDNGLISDEAFESVTNVRDEVNQLASDAERAAQAFEQMSLDTALGQRARSPLAQQLGQEVLSALPEGLLTDAQIAEFSDVVQGWTGELSALGMTWRDQMSGAVGQVYSQFGAEAATGLLSRIESELQRAALQGRAPLLSLGDMGYYTDAQGNLVPLGGGRELPQRTWTPADLMGLPGFENYTTGREQTAGAYAPSEQWSGMASSATTFADQLRQAADYTLSVSDSAVITRSELDALNADALPGVLLQSEGWKTQISATEAGVAKIQSIAKDIAGRSWPLIFDVKLAGEQTLVQILTPVVGQIMRSMGGVAPNADSRKG